jgi:hypothetical protein
MRFLLRHWTATLLIVAAAGWALFYVPNTPAFAVFELKRAIDARDADRAAQFIDFESVVKHAGNEIAEGKGGGDVLSQFISKGAVEIFAKPMAGFAETWAKRQVSEGDKSVQMPAGAVAASIILLHRDGDTAYTNFKDHKGQVWELHMVRKPGGQWQVVEVKNIEQFLEKLKRSEAKRFNLR